VFVARERQGTDGSEAASEGADPGVRQFWRTYHAATEHRLAGRKEDAIRGYDAALRLRSDHEDSLYYRGNCAADLGRYEEAVRSYERLVGVETTSARGFMQLGLIHASLDERAPIDLDRAEREFARAFAIGTDSGGLLAQGELALRKGDWPRAEHVLQQVHEGDAMGMAAPYLLGFLSWRAKNHGRAWTFFQSAVARAEAKKPPVKWTEEGDVKADPALRWQAVARQTITGQYWIRLRRYREHPATTADMDAEYDAFARALSAARRI